MIHVAFIAILSRAKLESPKSLPTQIELSIVSEPARGTAESEPEAAQIVASNEAPPAESVAPSSPSVTTPPPRRKRKTEDAPPQEPPPANPAATEAAPAPAESTASEMAINAEGNSQPSAAPHTTWQPKKFNLSAQRAASSMIDSLEMPARACNPRAPSSDAAACSPEERAARIKRELDLGLSRAANAPAYKQKREPPELHRQGDGSYRYDGHVFTAKIQDDGHVQFFDGTAGIDGPASIGPGIAGHFDLNDAIEGGMGKELYTSEKRWFLEQTAELRDKLTASARNKESIAARRMLESALERILTAREAPARKRERILALWEDCGDDAESADTRRVVEVFVRTRMPDGSELGFTKPELERFNRGRTGPRAFNPYRS